MKKLLTLALLSLPFVVAATFPGSTHAACSSQSGSTCSSLTANKGSELKYSIDGNIGTFWVKDVNPDVTISAGNLCLVVEKGPVSADTQNYVAEEDIYLDENGGSLQGGEVKVTFNESGTYNFSVYTIGPRARNSCIYPVNFEVNLPSETPPPRTTATPTPSSAGGGTSPKDCEAGETWVETFKGCYSFTGFINISLEWLMIAAALLALFRFTVGGIQYIFSQGQPDKLESAQQTITSAIFGLVLVFIAWVLIQFVGQNTPEWWNINFFSISP